jgi:PEP-CTERM motif
MRSTPAAFAASFAVVACLCGLAVSPASQAAPFSVTLTIANPQAFTPNQLQIVQQAAAQAELLWENVITGYQPGISLTGISASITGTTSGFASANYTGTTLQGGFRLSTGGSIQINTTILEQYANFQGTGLNVIDELLAHETGHVLGIGTLWEANNAYGFGSGQYTGQYGVAAYRAEFDPNATFVPVELAGDPSTANKHWDQIMRSSVQEGNPNDPYSLSPLLGITDAQGRDFALELMTGAIDPDYGEPFLSNTTVQSLRDLGFAVVPEPATWILLIVGGAIACFARRTM